MRRAVIVRDELRSAILLCSASRLPGGEKKSTRGCQVLPWGWPPRSNVVKRTLPMASSSEAAHSCVSFLYSASPPTVPTVKGQLTRVESGLQNSDAVVLNKNPASVNCISDGVLLRRVPRRASSSQSRERSIVSMGKGRRGSSSSNL